jgi:hypothetical protein
VAAYAQAVGSMVGRGRSIFGRALSARGDVDVVETFS